MKAYNIYYKSIKINSKPIDEDSIKNILSERYVYNKIDDHTSERINVKDLKIIKCTVI